MSVVEKYSPIRTGCFYLSVTFVPVLTEVGKFASYGTFPYFRAYVCMDLSSFFIGMITPWKVSKSVFEVLCILMLIKLHRV